MNETSVQTAGQTAATPPARRTRTARAGAGLALLHRPRGGRSRTAADLRPHLAAGRTRDRSAQPGVAHRRLGRPQGGRRRSHRGRRHPGAPQHLPAPGHPPGRRSRRGEGAAVPVPRLDLPPRRHARRRAGEPHHPVPGQVEAVAVRGARRGVLRVDLRQPRSGRGAARRRSSRVSGRCWSAISAARWNRSARPASMSTIPSTRNSRTGRWPSTTTSRATTSRSRTRG